MVESESFRKMVSRIECLERRCRFWRWMGFASVLSLATIMLVGMVHKEDAEVPSIIRAANFVAVDERGVGVIALGTNIGDGRGAIEFLDKSGKKLITIGVTNNDAPFISLSDSKAHQQLRFDVLPEEGMGITLKRLKENSGLSLGASLNGVTAIGFMKDEKILLDLGVNPDSSARLTVRDGRGKEILHLPSKERIHENKDN